MGSADDERALILPLYEEDIAFSKRKLTTGVVRVALTTASHAALVNEELAREDVQVDRVRIDKVVGEMPQTREEGNTTIIPVVEEVVVVERRLVLREEIRITRARSVTRHTETVLLRTQQATVERLQSDDAGHPSRNNPKPN